jgi:hypothetical protein
VNDGLVGILYADCELVLHAVVVAATIVVYAVFRLYQPLRVDLLRLHLQCRVRQRYHSSLMATCLARAYDQGAVIALLGAAPLGCSFEFTHFAHYNRSGLLPSIGVLVKLLLMSDVYRSTAVALVFMMIGP